MERIRFQYTFVIAPELQHSNVTISENQLQLMIDRDKEHAGHKLGRFIAKHIGFAEQEDLRSFNNKRYVLDVVVFNTQKWWQFSSDLRSILLEIGVGPESISRVKELFNKLENPAE